jgi:N4-gp56 family major capsid protein|tara:strand:- start:1214 stop:2071 length:858 start_codon:yes stop_codon:yes gene_type:complete
MANNTTINSELFTNLLAEAQFAMYENSIARQIVTPFNFPSNAGKSLQIPVYSGVTATALTEGSAPSAADTNTTSVALALAEVGTYFQVTDMLRDSAQRDVIADLGSQAGRAIAEKMDADAFALFASFTNSVGTEDGIITVDHILDAVATLRGNKVIGPLSCVLGPRQALQLKKELAGTGGTTALTANAVGNEALRGYYIGTLAGCTVYESSLVKSDLDTDADSELNMVGAVFAPSAIGHAIRGGVTMEEQRQAAARATDIMISVVKGEAILQNTHGVKIVGSASD